MNKKHVILIAEEKTPESRGKAAQSNSHPPLTLPPLTSPPASPAVNGDARSNEDLWHEVSYLKIS